MSEIEPPPRPLWHVMIEFEDYPGRRQVAFPGNSSSEDVDQVITWARAAAHEVDPAPGYEEADRSVYQRGDGTFITLLRRMRDQISFVTSVVVEDRLEDTDLVDDDVRGDAQ